MIWNGIGTFLFWAATILLLTGRGEFLLAGYNLMPKDTKDEYKRENDLAAILKYVGRMVMLPLALVSSLAFTSRIAGFSILTRDGTNNFIVNGPVTAIVVVGVVIYSVYIIFQLNSQRFRRDNTNSMQKESHPK